MRVPSWLPLLLGLLTAVGPMSTDMYLPAFPDIESSLGGQPGTAQITLAAWFAGLAVGQLAQGPLSDRFGRRGPLIFGCALYTLTAAGCALSPDLTILSVMRFVSAFGGSASMVITRAVVRDLADGHAAAKMLSKLMLIMGAAPILAPSVGGAVLLVADWHAIFWICAVFGGVCLVLVMRFLPETLPEERRQRLGVAEQASRYLMILRERGFLTNALIVSFCMFVIFAYLGGSPTVYIDQFGLSPSEYGALVGLCAFGYIAGSQINPRILLRFGSDRVTRIAVRIYFGASLVLGVVAFGHTTHWWVLAIPIFVMLSCQGFINPNATVGALTRHPGHAGSASAMMGTIQFCLGAVSGIVVGVLTDGTPRPMAALMVFGAAAAMVCDIFRPLSGMTLHRPELSE